VIASPIILACDALRTAKKEQLEASDALRTPKREQLEASDDALRRPKKEQLEASDALRTPVKREQLGASDALRTPAKREQLEAVGAVKKSKRLLRKGPPVDNVATRNQSEQAVHDAKPVAVSVASAGNIAADIKTFLNEIDLNAAAWKHISMGMRNNWIARKLMIAGYEKQAVLKSMHESGLRVSGNCFGERGSRDEPGGNVAECARCGQPWGEFVHPRVDWARVCGNCDAACRLLGLRSEFLFQQARDDPAKRAEFLNETKKRREAKCKLKAEQDARKLLGPSRKRKAPSLE